MSEQPLFELDNYGLIKPEPIRPADPQVRGTVEEPRLSKQAAAILHRLQQGPATNADLVNIAQRFGARLHDLREAGYEIEITNRDRVTGVTTYRLKGC